MRAAELGVALALDAAVGEPPVRWHPVVWMGRLVDLLQARLTGAASPTPQDPTRSRRGGAVAAAIGALVVITVAAGVARLWWPLRAVVLWTLLSGRLLLREVAAVEHALSTGGVEAGRARVGWLVSRDTSTLSEPQVRAAAVQTLAENTTDGWVATVWWWSLAGLPGAALHRWFDTLDSRWGYLDDTWRDRGRAAARSDDVLAWLPARLTALLWRGRLDAAVRREARRTPSPNGGWSMGAAALATGSRLEKPGAYVLHPTGREPDTATVTAALADARRVMAAAAGLALVTAAARDRQEVC